MRLRIKNVGILSDSEIEIAGITVVAGENNTGKSTFGKALYSVFSALNHLEQRVEMAKRQNAVDIARGAFSELWKLTPDNWVDSISDQLMKNKLTVDLIRKIAESCPENLPEEKKLFVDKASEILSADEKLIKNRIILSSLKGEFQDQIQNQLKIDEDSKIELIIKEDPVSVVIEKETIKETSGVRALSHTPVYIDDLVPSFGNTHVMSFSRWFFSNSHNINLVSLINSSFSVNQWKEKSEDSDAVRGILLDQKLKPIMVRLDEICHGSLRQVEKEIKFVDKNMPGVYLDVSNVSSGLKTFLILQELIRSGIICDNGTIIMDEPEIHLHPQWQVVLAEMIVLLQKAMGLHVLITSHSPYFISAIDVFAKKHGVIENNRYYFSSRKGNSVDVKDVTDEICVIYDSLAAPYQTIQDEANRIEE